MQNVSSSNLSQVGYDDSKKVLTIRFHKGGLYEYYNVPINVYMGLMGAQSHGKYFCRYIRGFYRYYKVG